MTDRERLNEIAETVARIDERTEIMSKQSDKYNGKVDALEARTGKLEVRQKEADKSRGRIWKGIASIVLLVAAYFLERALDLM